MYAYIRTYVHFLALSAERALKLWYSSSQVKFTQAHGISF